MVRLLPKGVLRSRSRFWVGGWCLACASSSDSLSTALVAAGAPAASRGRSCGNTGRSSPLKAASQGTSSALLSVYCAMGSSVFQGWLR